MITNSLDAAVAQRAAANQEAKSSADAVIEVTGLRKQYGEHEAVRGIDLEVWRGDVALALIGDPELIFLDEPTTGFDPEARRAAWRVIEGLRRLDKTVFLTTHYMEEAERLADRIAIIAAGRIIAQGTPRTLGGRDTSGARIAFTLPPATCAADLPVPLADRAEGQDNGRVALTSISLATDLSVLANWALGRGSQLEDLEVLHPTLEDVYLSLVAQHQPDRS